MRSAALFLVLGLLLTAQPSKPSVEGNWEGAVDAMGTKLRLAVAVTRAPDGTLTATMDSPDQGAFGLPLQDVVLAGTKLTFALKVVNGSYEGDLNEAGTEINGTWTQGASLPLILKRATGKPVPLNRPQEPKPPLPYKAEDVVFTNEAAHIKLAGTLTMPQGAGPFPAIVLITGSGPQNRDEELLGHKPFLVLADYLTRKGIAVLRYDDRGTAKSEGIFAASTSEDFALDALAAHRYLGARNEIDPKHIGLLGHSEGGLIAPMIAAHHSGIAFIVLLAGPGVTGEEVILTQTVAIMKAQGAPQAQITRTGENQRKIFSILREETNPEKIAERMRAVDPSAPAGNIDAQIKSFTSPWMRFFAYYDPAAALEKVKCPVLAMNGELDLQVDVDVNLPAIEAALRKGGNRDYTLKRMPHLNHLFQTAKTGTVAEYRAIEETMSPVALDTISTWIRAKTGSEKTIK